VYQAHIHATDGKSKIKTKNTFNNTKFVLKQDLTLCKISDQVIMTENTYTQKQSKAQKKRQLAKAMIEATEMKNSR